MRTFLFLICFALGLCWFLSYSVFLASLNFYDSLWLFSGINYLNIQCFSQCMLIFLEFLGLSSSRGHNTTLFRLCLSSHYLAFTTQRPVENFMNDLCDQLSILEELNLFSKNFCICFGFMLPFYLLTGSGLDLSSGAWFPWIMFFLLRKFFLLSLGIDPLVSC